MARARRRRYANKRDPCCAGAARVVHSVADVPHLLSSGERSDPEQPVRGRLEAWNVAGSDDGLKQHLGSETVQRELGFPAQTSRENRQLKPASQPFEEAVATEPALAQDETVCSIPM